MYPENKRGVLPDCILGLGMTAVLLTLPAVAFAQTQQNLEQRVAKMERMLDSGTLLKLLQSVEELKAEVRELRGQLEQQQYSLSNMTDRQRELYLDVDRRLQRVETAGMAAGATVAAAAASAPGTAPSTIGAAPAGSTSGGTADTSISATGAAAVGVATAGAATQASAPQTAQPSVDPVKEQQAYQTAFNLLKAGRYDQAAKSFRSFLADYPSSKFADNAQYWLGESYYVTRNFDNAMREFDKLVTEHPESQKLTHALLKIGYIHDELGQKEKARVVLTDLTQNYPHSTAAGLAAKRLERMRSE
jgi:tol-pal system protein YbgF